MFRQIIHVVPNGIIVDVVPLESIILTTNDKPEDSTKIDKIKN
jgi:hypothetical protein